MDKNYLPTGKHWGLTISRRIVHTGPLMKGAKPKLILHTTEGSFSSAASKFNAGIDVPNCLIDPSNGIVIQYVSLGEYAKALEHPPGTQETNRAGCRQIEIAGKASESDNWPLSYYAHLASLCVLIEHRTGIRRRNYHPFTSTANHQAKRLTPNGFIGAVGYLGHEHVPNNSHWDPGQFRIDTLFAQMRVAEKHYI